MKALVIAATLPLWSSIWKETPLTIENTARPKLSTHLSVNETKEYLSLYDKIADPRIQIKMIRDLSKMNNELVVPQLYKLLRYTNSDEVKTEILAVLYLLRSTDSKPDVKTIKPYLSSQNSMQRAYAAGCLAYHNLGISNIIELLLTEKSEFVVSQTINELLPFAHEYKFDALNQLISSDKSSSYPHIIKLLVASKSDPDTNEELLSIARGDNYKLSSMIAQGLCLRTSGGVKIHSLLAKSKDERVRYTAAKARLNKAFIPALINLADDRLPYVASTALISLAIKDNEQVSEKLLGKLGAAQSQVREAAATSLIKIATVDEQLKQRLRSLLKSGTRIDAALRVINALNVDGVEDEIVVAAQKAKTSIEKSRVARAIGNKHIILGVPELIRFSTDKDSQVRSSAAKSLGYFKGQNVSKAISKLLDDKNNEVLVAALQSAGRMKDPSLAKRVAKFLDDFHVNVDVRAASCWAIARIGVSDKDIMDKLKNLCIKKVIDVDGGTMEFDSMIVRLSAYYATVDLAKQKPNNKIYLDNLEKSFMFASGKEFKKLIKEGKMYKLGKVPQKEKVTPTKPNCTVKSI